MNMSSFRFQASFSARSSSLLALFFFLPFFLQAQTRMRDIFASAPDTIFPLLTKNNRLDCIDFIENNMQAKVKNRLDDMAELTALTGEYLQMKISERSHVEMRMLSDSLFCLVNTYKGPASDSHVRFFDAHWHSVSLALPTPCLEEFWSDVPDSLQQEACFAQQSLAALTLIEIQVEKEEPVLVYTLQTSELVEKEKEVAQKYVHPLRFRWDGRAFQYLPMQ